MRLQIVNYRLAVQGRRNAAPTAVSRWIGNQGSLPEIHLSMSLMSNRWPRKPSPSKAAFTGSVPFVAGDRDGDGDGCSTVCPGCSAVGTG